MTENLSEKSSAAAPTLLSTEVLIGLATVPVLMVLVGGRVLSEAIQELGQMSEELFRGDRLPLLKLSQNDPTPTYTSEEF